MLSGFDFRTTPDMIKDYYDDKWNKKVQEPKTIPYKRDEPDCEMESKKQRILDLAKELGVEIDFV
jgi:hypothetical protein